MTSRRMVAAPFYVRYVSNQFFKQGLYETLDKLGPGTYINLLYFKLSNILAEKADEAIKLYEAEALYNATVVKKRDLLGFLITSKGDNLLTPPSSSNKYSF